MSAAAPRSTRPRDAEVGCGANQARSGHGRSDGGSEVDTRAGAARWSRPWVVVAAVGLVLVSGGLVLPWQLALADDAIAVPLDPRWWPWFLALLLPAVVVLGVAAWRGQPRGVVRAGVALLFVVPAAWIVTTSSPLAHGPGAVLALGGVGLLALAAALPEPPGHRRPTPATGGAIAATALLVVATALPWSVADPETGTFALPADEGWTLVGTIWLLAAVSLTITALRDRTVVGSWIAVAAAAAAIVAIGMGAGDDSLDRSSPGVRLALVAGTALLAAAIVRRREDDATRVESSGEGARPARRAWAAGAASAAWLALVAASAPWVHGPPAEWDSGPVVPAASPVPVVPVAWGADLVGQPAVQIIVVGAAMVALVVGWVGGRALPAASSVVGVAVTAVTAGPVMAGGPFTATATASLVLGVAATAVGTAIAVVGGTGMVRLAPLVALPGVALLSVPDLTPEQDGPYEVLQDGGGSLRPGAVATGTTIPTTSSRLDPTVGRYPIWLDDRPGVATLDGSYWIDEGRITPIAGDQVLEATWADQVGHHLVQEFAGDRAVSLRDLRSDEPDVRIEGVDRLAISPNGLVLLRPATRTGAAESQWYEGDLAAYAEAEAAVTGGASIGVILADDPAWTPLPIATGDESESVIVADDDALYVVGPSSVERVLPDGRRVPVLGGQCHPTSQAAGTYVNFGRWGTPVRRRLDPDADGALWFARLGPPDADRGDYVYRVSPDGRLEIVDHPLGHVESLETTGDGGLLLTDDWGRLLHLPDATSSLSPLPDPDDCAR